MAALRVRGIWSIYARLQSTVCLRGIPRDSTVEEVSTFLGAIPTERIKFSNNPAGKFTGWAVVTCQNAEEEAAVRAKHAANIRHRYIEVIDDHSDRRKEGAS